MTGLPFPEAVLDEPHQKGYLHASLNCLSSGQRELGVNGRPVPSPQFVIRPKYRTTCLLCQRSGRILPVQGGACRPTSHTKRLSKCRVLSCRTSPRCTVRGPRRVHVRRSSTTSPPCTRGYAPGPTARPAPSRPYS